MQKPRSDKRDCVIFDVDGTLWQSVKPIMHALNTSLTLLGSRVRADEALTKEIIGMRLKDIYKRLFAGIEPDIAGEDFERVYWENEAESVRKMPGELFAGEKEVLEGLSQRYRLFIVSNCQAGYSRVFTDVYGFDAYFIDRREAGATHKDKDENIRDLIEAHSIRRCVYVGDLPGDLSAARKAGVGFVHAVYGFGKIEDNVSRAYTFEGLPDAIEDAFLRRYGQIMNVKPPYA